VSSVPFTRTLPYVLRQQLQQRGVRMLIAEVAAIPDANTVTLDQNGVHTTVPRISGYLPTVGEPAYCLAADTLILALGAVGGAVPTGPTGPPGPAGPQGPPGQAAGKILYYATSDPSDIAGYKTLLQSPSTGPEQTVATVCTGVSVDFLVASFATDPGVPGAVDYPAGTAYRRIYAKLSSGTARFHLQVYKRDAAGVETLIRDELSPDFTDQTVALQEWSATAASAGALLATDRIVNKLYAQRVTGGGGTITVTTYYEGTAHTSQIQTTISAGAQGPQGPPGPATFISGSGAPTAGVGVDGAFYLDTTSSRLWGPKASGAWPGTPLGRLLPLAPTYAQLKTG